MSDDQSSKFSFVPVPPPKTAPVQERAILLGLPRGLIIQPSTGGQWRCGNCEQMQRDGTDQVLIPDSVRAGDPAWSVTEAARLNAYNGEFTAWCIPCAQGLGEKKS